MQNLTSLNERIEAEQLDQDAMAAGISQVGIGVIVTLAALIGIWGVACLFGGINQDGNLMEMARGWLTAVTGM